MRAMLDDPEAVRPTGRDHGGRGTVAENPVTVNLLFLARKE
jgi:hypothetical protein